MADAVTTLVQSNGAKYYVATFTNVSDGTGESNVVKVDKSTLVNELGREPRALNIESISWSIQGFTSVLIEWDHATDDTAFLCGSGPGYFDGLETGPLKDPQPGVTTGDILFTTSGAVSGATYSITLKLIKVGSL